MKTKQDVINAISGVEHPAIAYSLLELGIIRSVEVNDNNAFVTFAFPFPNIPIANQLVNLISTPIQNLGFNFDHTIVVMNDEERAKFMKMETLAWKG